MSKSDFISWDDDLNSYDLDILLGEYTDNELFVDSDSEEDISEIPAKKPKQKELNNSATAHGYECPLCNKYLKTLSGFRGHTSKQHGRQDLKVFKPKYKSREQKIIPAYDHRVTNSASNLSKEKSNKIEVKKEKNTDGQCNFSTTYDTIFHTAYIDTADSIISDPIQNLFGDSAITEITNQCKTNNEVEQFFQSLFSDLFKFNANLCLSHDREMFFSKFHKVRLSKSVTEAYSTLFSSNEFLESDFKNFLQVFMLELINQLLNQQCLHETQKSNIQQSELSDKDQSILFYISGYIIRACSKKCCKLTGEKKGSKMACIDRLRSQSSTSSFLTRFSKWTIKNDRGGLIVPCDNFYLLIREFEMVVKKNIPSNICASSFLCKKLQENIMESYMVKYYSEKVFTDLDFSQYILVLEDIIKLFLTIRGNAFTRVHRNNIIQNKKVVKKSSSSLRQALKERHVNN